MSLVKEAQFNLDGTSIAVDDLDLSAGGEGLEGDSLFVEDDWQNVEDSLDLLIKTDDLTGVTDGPDEVFVISNLPGAEDDDDDLDELEVQEDDEDDVEVEDNIWAWKLPDLPNWAIDMIQNKIPTHSGKDVAGIDRAIGFLEAVKRELSKGVRSDINGLLDSRLVQHILDQIDDGIDRLEERKDKILDGKKKSRKKKSETDNEMVKEGQKSTQINGITITVPLFISTVVRTCINSMVSAGKDVEDCFDQLSKKYGLTPREEMEAIQLFSDMGYAVRRPRGYNRDEEIDYTSPDNLDWTQNFVG